MRERFTFAAPLFVALALHAWASGAYPQDIFVLVLALAAIPLGGRVAFGVTAQRVFAGAFFLAGAAIGWAHAPELGYGPGTLPRSASLIALGSLLAAVSRVYVRSVWSGEQATFVLGMLAVAASGATRLGPAYGVLAGAYLALAFVALRARDPARARALDLGMRHRVALASAIVLASAIGLGLARVVPPLRDAAQRALERAYVVHDMVGFGAGSSLGEMHDMIESDVEVLRVTPPPRSLPVDYLRGAVYDEYRHDGFWEDTPPALHLRDVSVPSALDAPGAAVHVRRVTGTAGRYFLPLGARDVRVTAGEVEMDDLGSILTVGSDHATEYSFALGPRDKLVPAAARPQDLRIPRSEREALAQLAREWTAGAVTDEDKLDAIGAHLDHGYRYSLTLARDADDPLLDFLFRQKVGYCTYFATALALVARASGIPTRLVTGYRVAEWSPVTRDFIVREKNAHAWVEAWVNGGWRTYDPTPMVELPQDVPHTASFVTLATDAAARVEQAVAYAVSHVTLVQLIAALATLGTMWAGVRGLRNRAASKSSDLGADRLERPLRCFEDLASTLERRGLARGKSEPLERFARRLDESGLAEAARLVERYAALRYGGEGERGALEQDVQRFVGGAGVPS